MWIIDFGWQMNEATAALYEGPFAYIEASVKPIRTDVLLQKREAYRNNWWRHVEPRPGMWSALAKVSRFLTTTTVSKHRVFGWFTAPTCPDHQLIVLARDDDTFFGILQSHLHEIWSLLLGTSLEDRPRYTPTTTFETFPFPEGLTPNLPADSYKNDPRARAIADAAKDLNAKREAWLNPPDLVDRVPEVVPGYPDMLIPKSDAAAAELRRRTLTNLYNARPTWLDMAHKKLDAAVADAYGWPSDLSDEEILKRLFDLNQERSNSGR
jgi:type II restriction/modification system DNA methylase subunit YeeA